jgi:F-type H+-transporting ATPase subunit epsilon
MKTIPVNIVTPDKTELSDQFEFVVLPGASGELGVYPGHAHCLAILKAGPVRLQKESGKQAFAIESGYAIISPTAIKIMTSAAKAAA